MAQTKKYHANITQHNDHNGTNQSPRGAYLKLQAYNKAKKKKKKNPESEIAN